MPLKFGVRLTVLLVEQFSGPEKIMFLAHLKTLIESFIESEATAEMALKRGLSMADQAAEEINQRR